mgnify:CR=1 FL=1|jgi:rubredoxin-NAD+ reductase
MTGPAQTAAWPKSILKPLKSEASMRHNESIVIAGAGLAGWTVAREVRKRDAHTPITLVTADAGDFYAKPSLSNAFAQNRTPAQLITKAGFDMAQSLSLTLLPHTRIASIDPSEKALQTSAGPMAYTQLVLATGAQPIRLSLSGDAAEQVMSINSLEDFAAFHTQLSKAGAGPRKVLIMGAGLIGCEFANDLALAGHQVHVVDPSQAPIAALLPPQVGQALCGALAKLGVRWHLGQTVNAVEYSQARGDDALLVHLSTGEVLACDQVVSAVGLRADLRLAQAAGLACSRGIEVDPYLQTSAAHIFALGDAAQYAHGFTLPYVMPIMHAGKALAATLTGTPSAVHFPLMPIAIKTPALPLLVAPPGQSQRGHWRAESEGAWLFVDASAKSHGFVLMGEHTRRRGEFIERLYAADLNASQQVPAVAMRL